ncbi:hypothetical protein Q9L58_010767, partial [Maublancomyces gigas]
MNPIELRARLGDDNSRRKLRRAICNFPTEWDRKTIEARHSWLRNPDETFKLDMDGNWARFMAHCKVLSFDELPDEYLNATWHFNPKEFITAMRKCRWLSLREMTPTLPRHMFYTAGATREAITRPPSTYELAFTDAQQRLAPYAVSLNKILRKYVITTWKRQAHFLAQITLETAQWRSSTSNPMTKLMHE